MDGTMLILPRIMNGTRCEQRMLFQRVRLTILHLLVSRPNTLLTLAAYDKVLRLLVPTGIAVSEKSPIIPRYLRLPILGHIDSYSFT